MLPKNRSKPLPTQAVIKSWLRYEPETGNLFWIRKPGKRVCVGDIAGKGKLRIGIAGVQYQKRRIIWLYVYGSPVPEIGHINHDPYDYRIKNLRSTEKIGQQHNRKKGINNITGFTGVSFRKKVEKYRAQIMVGGTAIELGNFDSLEEAIIARKRANVKYKFHANHGV